jgi:CubicO group peptidase (beta-lactamase class C family)
VADVLAIEQSGVDAVALERALALAISGEPALPRDMRAWLTTTLADEPWPQIMGDVIERGAPSGVVLAGGREIASWGDADRVEMCFSLAKSALSTVAGIAWADGLLTDLDAPFLDAVPQLEPLVRGGTGNDPHAARAITWRHLLTQSSDWRGELFGVPWWADPQGRQRPDAPVLGPGARFSYNDIRTNLCSLALTHLLGESVEQVFRTRVFDPIGVASQWSWRGLRQMRDTLPGGREVPIVTGGSHWGGGWWCSARDLARYGLLHLRDGDWEGMQVLPAEWCRMQREPSALRPAYGLMWWLNELDEYPGAGLRGFAAHGTGEQLVWCDPERDLVAVIRWAREPLPILAALTEAIPPKELNPT